MSESVEQAAPREITMANRVKVAGIATSLIDDGFQVTGDALIAAVRCCDEFPSCAHILNWTGECD